MSSPRSRLAGKVTLITGAGSGIGRASALLFASEGAAVVCADREDSGEDTARQIQDLGGSALGLVANVSSAASVEAMIKSTRDAFGKIDVLFNNAGTSLHCKLHEMSEEQWDRLMGINLKSVYLCSKAVIPGMLEQGHGAIVSTASTFGILAFPGFPAYCASKAGVVMLTKQMALDYGPAIRVNCVCPGATDTALLREGINRAPNPQAAERRMAAENGVMNRLAQPLEIAYAALFLASDEASFITGHALVADGGMTIDA